MAATDVDNQSLMDFLADFRAAARDPAPAGRAADETADGVAGAPVPEAAAEPTEGWRDYHKPRVSVFAGDGVQAAVDSPPPVAAPARAPETRTEPAKRRRGFFRK